VAPIVLMCFIVHILEWLFLTNYINIRLFNSDRLNLYMSRLGFGYCGCVAICSSSMVVRFVYRLNVVQIQLDPS